MSRLPDTTRSLRALRAPDPAREVAPDPAAFLAAFDEPLLNLLDLASWRTTRDPATEYQRIEAEVQRAIEAETGDQTMIRRNILPLVATAANAPRGAGVYAVPAREILETQQGLLFSGAVEACDGSNQVHDTLALTIHQIGIALVSYQGQRDALATRLFRRDLRTRNPDPVQAVLDLLEQRGRRGSLDHSVPDALSELAQRGLMSYGERALLAGSSTARWRMGHGNPAPLELIGARFTDLVIESIRIIRRLIDHQRFVFVVSAPADRGILTLGQGLHPLEYAIIGTLRERIAPYVEDWAPTHPATVDLTWDGDPLRPQEWVRRFRDEVAPQVVYGLYRATRLAPPQMFFAHIDHADLAARIALADSVHLEERGFPLLIDLADHACRAIYGGSSLREMASAAYAVHGAPFRFQSERPTRPD